MFYSQTFLARKGPLGTVWCAAHLQHRVKKSHYISTDIPSTVERIISPEVPIALRMSGHLLLGVVRIYSKKVDIVFDDCKDIVSKLNKAFVTKKVDLPDNEMKAPPQAVTLPKTFSLDAQNIDDDALIQEGSPDTHLSNEDDIRLPAEQIPTGTDPYTRFDEDMENVLQPEAAHDSGDQPMDEDVSLHVPMDANIQNEELNASRSAFQDPRTEVPLKSMDPPGNRAESPNTIPQDIPDIEVRRDAVHDLSNEGIPPGHSDWRKNATDDITSALNDEEIRSPNLKSVSPSGGKSMPFHEHSEQPTSAAPQESPRLSFGHKSPQLVLQSSPPAEAQQPRIRRRRQRMFFDNELVLPNKYMKRALEDTSDLIRERRNALSSPLAIWKSKIRSRKEQVFDGPSLTGMCADLSDMFRKDYISGRPNLVVVQEETVPNSEIPQSPIPNTEPMDVEFPATATATEASPAHNAGRSAASLPEMNTETELLRDARGSAFDNVLPGFEPSPSRMMMSSSPGRGDSTPLSMHSIGSDTVPLAGGMSTGTGTGTGVLPTPSTGTHGSEFKTPPSGALFDEENTCLSDIPETAGSAEADDLNFLEADNGTPSESQGSRRVDSLSVRSRAVAQYLKRQSSAVADLSLNKILEGKTRKIAARMFYETLVLKSCKLIDVEQKEAYGDITIKLNTMQLLSPKSKEAAPQFQ